MNSRPFQRADCSRHRSRREFLRRTATSLATTAVLPTAWSAEIPQPDRISGKKTLVGSNVYGWGQYAQRDHKPLDVGDVISALRDTGYDYLESNLNVNAPDENGRFADQLRAKGLLPVSLYTGARLHEANTCSQVVAKIATAARVAKQAGFYVISCNVDPIGREKTDEELKIQATAVSELGQALESLGLRLGIHQHLPEMANHAREFHAMFDHTAPEVVGWCYDVHWVWKGGVSPMDALRQYGRRVATWHLRQSRDGVWWEDLDTGDVDYSSVAQYANEHHLARRFSVELALESGTRITRSVVENHRRSREFVRRTFES
jgi:inosose dehydratase